MRKPKDSQQVSMRIPTALLKAVDERIKKITLASGLSVSRGSAIRAALTAWLDNTKGWAVTPAPGKGGK